jgi:hypothetical protein
MKFAPIFSVHDQVQFFHAKLRRNIFGRIIKITTKCITIDAGDVGLWNVLIPQVEHIGSKSQSVEIS